MNAIRCHHIPILEASHFPPQNLPWGVFRERAAVADSETAPVPRQRQLRVGLAIGESVLDASVLAEAGCFEECDAITDKRCFHQVGNNSLLEYLCCYIAPPHPGNRISFNFK